MKKLSLENVKRLSRNEMKKIMAGDSEGSCSGSCTIGTNTGECYTPVGGGCRCNAVGIGIGSCGG